MMEQNKDKRTGENDILNEAAASRREAPASMDETIVFRRDSAVPRTGFRMGGANTAASSRPDMGDTAQIRGGAVVRPLKQNAQPQSPSNAKPTQPPQKRQPVNAPVQNSMPQSSKGAVPNRAVNDVRPSSVQANRPQNTSPKTTVPPLNRSGVNGQPPSLRRPADSSSQIRHDPSTPQRPAVSANKPYVKNSTATSAPQPHPVKRTENDDFEIDEATYNREMQRRLKYGNKKDGYNRVGDSASSAIMSLVKAMVYIVAVILVSVGLSLFVINTANDVFKFVTDERIVTVDIPEYASIDDVADALYDAGAIKYKWAFKIWSRMKDSGAEFIPGTYEVSTSLNYDYLRASFKKSFSREVVRITIPEGYTIDEMINLFVVENGIGTREGFIDVINNYEFTKYRFINELTVTDDRFYRLEGYLFPDTYDFYKDSSELTVITKLLDNFDRKFATEYYDRAAQLGMTVDQAITLASMIEKEARYADDLGGVSSVFHNRLKYSATFPYLNSDATIMYAIAHDTGSRQETMTSEDTKYDSIYNTYTHRGLPPSAIANPGINSIKYALYPNDTNYFYFVSDARGRMLYAKTEQEHIKNINTVRGN